MGLKGYRLWVMGQLDSNVQSPTLRLREGNALHTVHPAVAAHLTHSKANFETRISNFTHRFQGLGHQNLKPGYHISGFKC
jgi:hypothetical protein